MGIEFPKNLNSDLVAALEKYGVTDFLILGLQEVPGSSEQREVWGLSTQDLKKFAEGLSKILADPEGPGKLIKMIFGAHDILRRQAEVEALIKSQKEGKA